jgi:ArsR family transcriptional regulator
MTKDKTDVCDEFSPGYDRDDPRYRELLDDVTGISEIFKVLADETRTKITYLLLNRELCVCDIADILEMSLPAVSHHLRLLRNLRLVKYRRKGKQAFYSLDDSHIDELIRVARDHHAEEV